MEMDRFSYYDVLEISPHCAQHEITTAYQRAKATYATENPAIYTIFSEDEARDLVKLIEEAYSVLGNKTLRAVYDEKMAQGQMRMVDIPAEHAKAQSRHLVPDQQRKSVNLKVTYQPNPEKEELIRNKQEWDGASIKEVREYKNVSVERMAEITRISPYYIQAVEAMDPSGLPAPVFIRGYVVQISKVLGLDEKLVPNSYMNLFKSRLESK